MSHHDKTKEMDDSQVRLIDEQQTQAGTEDEKEGAFNDALNKAEKSLKVYPARYIMAVLYSLMCLAISLEQSMYVVITSKLVILYDTSEFVVTANSLIHMLLHFPLSFPANFVVDRYGIKAGLIVAGFFLLIGSWVRCLVNVNGGSFGVSIIGAFCVGTANPFIINSLNKVSANWFYPSQRPAVTSFLSFFSTVTGLAGIFIPGIWFSGYNCTETECDIQKGRDLVFSLSVVLAIIETCFIVPNILFFKEKPPTPPSFVDDVEREDFSIALKVLARDKIYLLQAFVFAVFYGSFQDIATLLELICKPYGFDDSLQVAMLSAIPIVSGIGGCVLSSMFLKKTQQYRRAIMICQVGSTAALVSFAFLLYSGQYWLITIPAFGLGFFIIPMIPTMTEWTCETSYPIGEPTVTGFLWAIAHIFAGCAGFAFTALAESGTKGAITLMASIIAGLFVIAFFATFFIRAPLKRLQAEKERSQQAGSDSSQKYESIQNESREQSQTTEY